MNPVIAVTGAFGVLGGAVASALARDAVRVALVDRSAAAAGVPPPGSVVVAGVDLGDEAAAKAAFARIVREAGRLDGLVNVAGGFHWETVADGSLATWDAMWRQNLLTALNATRAALPHLADGGRIVNIGAQGAVKAAAGMGAYAAAKAGVAKLTEALAEELAPRRITVNAVLPGIIDTPRNRADMPGADVSRWVSPAAVADLIAFLVSDAARAVTGALIPVTGAA